MSEILQGIYRHYKGALYEVIGVGRHTETMEELVTYRDLEKSEEFGDNALWSRPKTMFLESVRIDGRDVPRFTYLGENLESLSQEVKSSIARLSKPEKRETSKESYCR